MGDVNRPGAGHPVEIGTGRVALFGQQGVVIAGAADPVPGADLGLLGLEARDDIFDVAHIADGRAVEVGDKGPGDFRTGKMTVGIIDPGDHGLAVQIHHPGVGPDVAGEGVGLAHREDFPVAHRNGPGRTVVLVHGQYIGIGIDHLGVDFGRIGAGVDGQRGEHCKQIVGVHSNPRCMGGCDGCQDIFCPGVCRRTRLRPGCRAAIKCQFIGIGLLGRRQF